MRITQNSMSRRYLNNINRSLSDLSLSNQKLSTGRNFFHMSDSVTRGTRALGIRTQLYKNEQLQSNAKTVQEELSIAEDNLTSVNEILQTINGKVIAAQNGPNSQTELNIYANEFDALRDAVLQFSNCTYDEKYIFGGTNNVSQPFTLNDAGELLYNGVAVNDVTYEDGVYRTPDGTKVPYSEDIFLDLGIGMRFTEGAVDKRTVVNSSVSGLKALGYGTTELNYKDKNGEEATMAAPNNIYDLISSVSDALRSNDMEKLSALGGHLKERMGGVVAEIADIGVRYQFVDTNISRLETEHLSLKEMSGNVEGVQDADEIVNYKSYQYAYSLVLQFGSTLVPQSLMDYIR